MGGTGKKKDEIDALVNRYKQDKDGDSDSDAENERPRKPFVDWFSFNLFVGFIIAVNAGTMGAETDARSSNGDDNVSAIWYIIEIFFSLFFVWELGMRLYFHRLRYFRYASKEFWWNVVDTFIVVLSVVDTFIITPLGATGQLRFVSMLRFVRLCRLIRLIRLMRLFKELWLVANGLVQSSKTLCWVCLMIFIFIYICSIFTTLEIGKKDSLWNSYYKESGGWDHEKYFKTVPRSMFTLFQVVTLEQWSEIIVRHVMVKQPMMVPFFMVVIAITTFGLLNIVIGVIVENTLSTSERDDNKIKRSKERDRQRVFGHLREIFESADENGDGRLNLAEVVKAINKPEIYNKLKMIEFPVDDPKQIFELLDYDHSGYLSIDEFITGCIRMKGTAKSKDLLVAQVAVDTMKRHYMKFEQEMRELQQKIILLEDTARSLVDQGEHVFLNLREYRMRHQDEVRGSSPPRISTGTINRAPWESRRGQGLPRLMDSKQDNASNMMKPALADGFARPDSNLQIVEFDSDNHENADSLQRRHDIGFPQINDADQVRAIEEAVLETNAAIRDRQSPHSPHRHPMITQGPDNNGRSNAQSDTPALMDAAADRNSGNQRNGRGNVIRQVNPVTTTDLALPGSMN